MRLLCIGLAALGARGAATPEKCEQWAREGECVKNHKFMLVECRAACASDARAPPSPEHDCRSWAEADECSKNVRFMNLHCGRPEPAVAAGRRAVEIPVR